MYSEIKTQGRNVNGIYNDIIAQTNVYIECDAERLKFQSWLADYFSDDEGVRVFCDMYSHQYGCCDLVERWRMGCKMEAGLEAQVQKLHRLSQKIRECLLDKAPIEKTHDLRGQWLRIYWHLPSATKEQVVEKTVYEDLQAGCRHWFPRLGTKFSESYIEKIRAKFEGRNT